MVWLTFEERDIFQMGKIDAESGKFSMLFYKLADEGAGVVLARRPPPVRPANTAPIKWQWNAAFSQGCRGFIH